MIERLSCVDPLLPADCSPSAGGIPTGMFHFSGLPTASTIRYETPPTCFGPPRRVSRSLSRCGFQGCQACMLFGDRSAKYALIPQRPGTPLPVRRVVLHVGILRGSRKKPVGTGEF